MSIPWKFVLVLLVGGAAGLAVADLLVGVWLADLPEGSRALRSELGRIALQASIVALLVTIGVGFLYVRSVTRAIDKLTESTRGMVAGDFTPRPAQLFADDEVGNLGATLTRLSAAVETTTARLTTDRDLYIAVVDGMREGVMVTDVNGLVTLTNRSLQAALGMTDAGVGRQPIEVTHLPELADALDEACRRAAVTSEAEISFPHRRTLLISAAPLPASHGGAVAVVLDITELRRLERVRRDFVANVSHELRTPITSVLAAAETLESGAREDPAAAARFVGTIYRNASRLASIVEDLLRLSRIESGEWRYEMTELKIRDVVAGVVEETASSAAARQVTVANEVSDPALAVRADEAALRLAVGNLVENAIKYSPSGARVQVTAEVRDGQVTIAVHDRGIGIDAPALERIFERFYRVDKGRSREEGGTGLGLSIVKNLVQGMGGEVSVASEPGKGSIFRVTLPRGEASS